MLRRQFLGLMFAAVIGSGTAMAQSLEQQLVRQLRDQGFSQIQVSNTWLGRVRIQAEGNGQHREIIVNPRTGEILRDYWRNTGGDTGSRLLTSGKGSSGSGSSGSNDDDDGDDDDNDDGDDDGDDDDGDNSGKN